MEISSCVTQGSVFVWVSVSESTKYVLITNDGASFCRDSVDFQMTASMPSSQSPESHLSYITLHYVHNQFACFS